MLHIVILTFLLYNDHQTLLRSNKLNNEEFLRKKMGNRFQRIVITVFLVVFSVGGSPPVCANETASSQPTASEPSTKVGKAKAEGNPLAATTTKNSSIDIKELELTIKPLNVEELQNEAISWMLLLKEKQKEIANTEIAIQRQNSAINKQKEALVELEQAKKDLAETEKTQVGFAKGSPEYEAAFKKIEETKENIKKAQEKVKEASTTEKTLKNEKGLSNALTESEQTEELESSHQFLEAAKKVRSEFVFGSFLYQDATKKIDKLEEAISTFEKAEKVKKSAKPKSPEQKQAKKNLEIAQDALKKAREEIKLPENSNVQIIKENSQKLDKAAADVKKIDVKVEDKNQTTGEPSVNQGKGQKLKQITQDLQKNTDNQSNSKIQLVNSVTRLQAERTAIVDRLNTVLNELDIKGGDSKPYRDYIQAIGAIKINVEDTQGLVVRIVGWLKSTQGGLRWGQNLGQFLGIVLISFLLSQLLGAVVNLLLSKFGNTSRVFREFLVMVIKRGGVVVGLMFALTALEISFGPILALFGGVSFILAFALQTNLSNFASGLLILAYKPFDVDDEIRIKDISGNVEAITLANTELKGGDGEKIIVPNNDVWHSIITNYTKEKNRVFKIQLQIPLKQDISLFEKLLLEIAKSNPDVLLDPAPKISISKIENYYATLYLIAWTQKENNSKIVATLNRMIIEKFQKEGVALGTIPPQENHLIMTYSDPTQEATPLTNGTIP